MLRAGSILSHALVFMAQSTKGTEEPTTIPPDLGKYSGFYINYEDRFGDDTTMPLAVYSGGRATFICSAPNNLLDCRDPMIIVFGPKDLPKRSKNCTDPNKSTVFDSININESYAFGRYRCKHRNLLPPGNWRSITVTYRICDNREKACQEQKQCQNNPNSFCIITEKQKTPSCSPVLNDEICQEEKESPLFPVYPVDTRTVCGAIATNYKRAWGVYDRDRFPTSIATEKPDSFWPQLYYSTKPKLYMEPINLTLANRTVQIIYQDNEYNENKTIKCVTKNERIVIANFTESGLKKTDTINVALADSIFNSGAKIYKITCGISGRSIFFSAKVENILVFMGGTLKIDGNPDNFACRLHPEPTTDFSVAYSWYREGTKDSHNGSVLIVKEKAQYRCAATITYKSCSPYRVFKKDIPPTDYVTAYPQTTTSKAQLIVPWGIFYQYVGFLWFSYLIW